MKKSEIKAKCKSRVKKSRTHAVKDAEHKPRPCTRRNELKYSETVKRSVAPLPPHCSLYNSTWRNRYDTERSRGVVKRKHRYGCLPRKNEKEHDEARDEHEQTCEALLHSHVPLVPYEPRSRHAISLTSKMVNYVDWRSYSRNYGYAKRKVKAFTARGKSCKRSKSSRTKNGRINRSRKTTRRRKPLSVSRSKIPKTAKSSSKPRKKLQPNSATSFAGESATSLLESVKNEHTAKSREFTKKVRVVR